MISRSDIDYQILIPDDVRRGVQRSSVNSIPWERCIEKAHPRRWAHRSGGALDHTPDWKGGLMCFRLRDGAFIAQIWHGQTTPLLLSQRDKYRIFCFIDICLVAIIFNMEECFVFAITRDSVGNY